MPPKDKLKPDEDLARRMFAALNALEADLGRRLTLEELGARVAGAYPGRDEDFSPSVVRRWFKGLNPPRTRTGWIALATALGVDPGWLTYGTGVGPAVSPTPSMPMAPANDEVKKRKRG